MLLMLTEGTLQDTRLIILEAARELFTTQGYHKTTMRKIADAAGISTGPLYFHFHNKAEVFTNLCSEAFDMIINSYKSNIKENDTATDQLITTFKVYRDFAEQKPEYLRLIRLSLNPLSEIDIPDNLKINLYKKTEEIVLVIESIVRKGIENGEFNFADPRDMTLYLFSAVEGITSLNDIGVFEFAGRNVDHIIKESIKLVMQGIIPEENIS